jgi:hypothetical protein
MTDSPYELQKMVTVATFTFPWEAQVAKARLDAFGIAAIIAGEHTIRMVALSYALGGIQVQVSERDAAAARDVLQHRAQLPEIYLVNTAAPPEPAAGGEDTGGDGLKAGEGGGDGWGGRPDGALVTVARFFNPWDAHLARTLLESEGIACCVFEDRVPLLNLISGAPLALNRLEVHDYNAERAAALLSRSWPGEDEPAEDDAAD